MQLICDTLAAMFDRRRLEKARHRIEARFRTLPTTRPTIVILCDSEGVAGLRLARLGPDARTRHRGAHRPAG
jgi:hypothetical protein